MGEDKYLERLKSMRDVMGRISYLGGARSSYRSGKAKGLSYPLGYGKYYDLGWSRQALNDASKSGNIEQALQGAYSYKEIGKGGKPFVKNKLLDALSKGMSNRMVSREDIINVEKFLKQNPTKPNTLEKTASGAAMVLGIVGGLFLLAPTINGNVVGFDSSPRGIWGIIVFSIGFLGAYLFFRE
ncbi:MAG: hypothetical protein AABX48_02540 [Nanoarchaeota archaeon]